MGTGQIRIPPSGPLLQGSAPGDTLIWNHTLRRWETGPAGAGSPLSAEWWVDAASLAGTPDGSPSSPFATIADALAAAAAEPLTILTLNLVPGSYAGAAIDFDATGLVNLQIVAAGVRSSESNQLPQVGNFTWTPSNAVTATKLQLVGIYVVGALTIADALVTSARLTIVGCAVASIASSDANTDVFGIDSTAGGVSCKGADFTDCRGLAASGSFGINAITVTNGLRARDSWLELGSITGSSTLTDCTLSGVAGAVSLSDATHIWQGCEIFTLAITLAVPGVQIFFDGTTAYWFNASTSLVNGQIVVTERAQRATLAVAVPALAAGALGYVDVSTAGTDMAGIFETDAIGWNPKADVEAAGVAGGGPISARVSNVETIRVGFVGPTTSHNVDFVFWKV
jgi:hypothetical protein